MLTLAATKRFWICSSYALLHLHCPPPTIFSGRGVPFSHCLLSRGGGSTGTCIVLHLGVKTFLKCLRVFRENISLWEFFFSFFQEAHLVRVNCFLHADSQHCLWGWRRPSATSAVYPSLAAYCLVYEPLTLQSCTPVQRNHLVKRVSGQSCFDYSLASTGWVLAGWERKMRAAQEEGQSQQTSCRTNKPFIVFIIKFSFHTCMC